MRIAFYLAGSDLGRSGIGVYVQEVLPRLVVLARSQGDEVVVVGTRADHRAFATADLAVDCGFLPALLDEPGPSALFHLVAAGALASRHRADVALLPAANRRLTAVSRVPTVAVVHDLAQLEVARKYDPLRMAYVKYAVMGALRRADSLVTVSGATRKDLAQALTVDPASIRVVLNGVDTARFHPREATNPAAGRVRRAHGLERPFLLYVSRLEDPGKNHLRLVEAFAASSLAASHDLILVGADWGAAPAITAAALEAGVGDRVRWLGFVDDADLPILVSLAAAVIMVGLREGFGLPALEAIAAGRPVCAANAGALPEVVGPYAALCDPYNVDSIRRALEAAVADEALRAKVAAEGPDWAQARGWGATAQGLYEACVAVVGDGARHSCHPDAQ